MGDVVRFRAVLDYGIYGCYGDCFLSNIYGIACVDIGGVCLFTRCDNDRRALSDYRHLACDRVDLDNRGVLALICNGACVGVGEGVCDCVGYVGVDYGACEVDGLLLFRCGINVHISHIVISGNIGDCGVGYCEFSADTIVLLLTCQVDNIHIATRGNGTADGIGGFQHTVVFVNLVIFNNEIICTEGRGNKGNGFGFPCLVYLLGAGNLEGDFFFYFQFYGKGGYFIITALYGYDFGVFSRSQISLWCYCGRNTATCINFIFGKCYIQLGILLRLQALGFQIA